MTEKKKRLTKLQRHLLQQENKARALTFPLPLSIRYKSPFEYTNEDREIYRKHIEKMEKIPFRN